MSTDINQIIKSTLSKGYIIENNCFKEKNKTTDNFKDILDYIISYPVDWEKETLEYVKQRLKKKLETNYPQLNEESLIILLRYFTYNWR